MFDFSDVTFDVDSSYVIEAGSQDYENNSNDLGLNLDSNDLDVGFEEWADSLDHSPNAEWTSEFLGEFADLQKLRDMQELMESGTLSLTAEELNQHNQLLQVLMTTYGNTIAELLRATAYSITR
ncbi:hypothetical protein I5192_03145 [Ruegeria sp. SCSIO 43209]|uniref:hypothetical protein n=1 Tax=Ruegeria sp. SCSIO 43209 TaxID=2793010 RepID=UPI001CA8D74F|nr:hypothetical protein [Ruegeria sp. SCSIO 43209]UAB89693.1 hypothetical protein I5192_03145 [Ruegeria sp. SCSIO 43209]